MKNHLFEAIQKPAAGWNPVGDHEIYAALADIAALQRDGVGLSAYAARAHEVAHRLGHTLYRAVATRALGILAWIKQDAPLAETLLLESLGVFSESGTGWQAGRTLFDLGELSEYLGREPAARDYYSRAAQAFEDLRAMPLAQQARARMASAGD